MSLSTGWELLQRARSFVGLLADVFQPHSDPEWTLSQYLLDGWMDKRKLKCSGHLHLVSDLRLSSRGNLGKLCGLS